MKRCTEGRATVPTAFSQFPAKPSPSSRFERIVASLSSTAVECQLVGMTEDALIGLGALSAVTRPPPRQLTACSVLLLGNSSQLKHHGIARYRESLETVAVSFLFKCAWRVSALDVPLVGERKTKKQVNALKDHREHAPFRLHCLTVGVRLRLLIPAEVYLRVGRNKVLETRPSIVHFAGFTAKEKQTMVLRIVNVSSSVQRIHILPPETSFFSIAYAKKGPIAPGMSGTRSNPPIDVVRGDTWVGPIFCPCWSALAEDVTISFMPTEWQYYYDTIRVHCQTENLLVRPRQCLSVSFPPCQRVCVRGRFRSTRTR